MSNLCSIAELQTINGQFIIVKSDQSPYFRLGVKSLAPGAEVEFMDVGGLTPKFENGAEPFSVQNASGANLACQVCNPSPVGVYRFAMTAEENPTAFPYVLHIASDGAESARCRMDGGKLKVGLTVGGKVGKVTNVLFTKERFKDAVQLVIQRAGGAPETLFIPEGQCEGVWQCIPDSLPLAFNVFVSPVGEFQPAPGNPLRNQLVGSDEGDLEIDPTDG